MAMLIYRHPVWFSSRYIIHELVSVLIYHSAIMHLQNCYAQVVLLCTGGATMHRWCCYAPLVHYAPVVLLTIADDTIQWQC